MTNTDKQLFLQIDELFQHVPEQLTLEKLELFFSKVFEAIFQKQNRNPNHLVRIVDNGTIHWMTITESEEFLRTKKDPKDEYLHRLVENALRGDSKVLEREIKTTYVLANGTLNSYRSKKLIPDEEIKRTEPHIIRLGRQLGFQFQKLYALEKEIEYSRQQNPILNEFEEKVSMLLRCQRSGKSEEAFLLAQELAKKKRNYLLASRGVQSFIRHCNRIRLELQRQKKSILSFYKYLTAQREGVLQDEYNTLNQTIENMQAVMARETGRQTQRYESALQEKIADRETVELELTAVQREKEVLSAQEKETEYVIQSIDEILNKRDEPKRDSLAAPAIREEKTEISNQPKSSRRMVVMQRKKP